MGRTITAIPRLSFLRSDSLPSTSTTTTSAPSAPSATESDGDSPESWLTAPDAALSWKATRAHGPGFRNLGNTCYMNSVLQCLLHLALVDRALQAWPATKTCRAHCVHCELAKLRNEYARTGSGGSISPRAFASHLRVLSRGFRRNEQHDAHEYFGAFMDSMVRASVLGCANSSPVGGEFLSEEKERSSLVHKVMGGVLDSVISCTVCGFKSARSENYSALSLEITRARSITQALGRFTAPEPMTGDNQVECAKCRRKVDGKKRYSIRQASNVLVLHLKRFVNTKKDNRHLDYEEFLDLTPYMVGAPSDVHAMYRLSGVVVHHGYTVDYGHYTSYVLGSNGTWASKDDEMSHSASTRSALGQQAYMLFYSRIPPPRPSRAPRASPSATASLAGGPSSNANSRDLSLAQAPKTDARKLSKLANGVVDKSGSAHESRPSSQRPPLRSKPHVQTQATSDLDLEILSITEGPPVSVAPVTNESSESTAPHDRDSTPESFDEDRAGSAELNDVRAEPAPALLPGTVAKLRKSSNFETASPAPVPRGVLSPSRVDPVPSGRTEEVQSRHVGRQFESAPQSPKTSSGADSTLDPGTPPSSPGAALRNLFISGSESVCRALRRAFGVPSMALPPPRVHDGSGSSNPPSEPSTAANAVPPTEPVTGGRSQLLIGPGSRRKSAFKPLVAEEKKSSIPPRSPTRSASTNSRNTGAAVVTPALAKEDTRTSMPRASNPVGKSSKAANTSKVNGSAPVNSVSQKTAAPPSDLGQLRKSDSPASGTVKGLFSAEGVGTWAGADGEDRQEESKPSVAKRKRHLDAIDAEYDAGKAKKVRKKVERPRTADGKPCNPFADLSAGKRG